MYRWHLAVISAEAKQAPTCFFSFSWNCSAKCKQSRNSGFNGFDLCLHWAHLLYSRFCFSSAECFQQWWPFDIEQPQTTGFWYVSGHRWMSLHTEIVHFSTFSFCATSANVIEDLCWTFSLLWQKLRDGADDMICFKWFLFIYCSKNLKILLNTLSVTEPHCHVHK